MFVVRWNLLKDTYVWQIALNQATTSQQLVKTYTSDKLLPNDWWQVDPMETASSGGITRGTFNALIQML